MKNLNTEIEIELTYLAAARPDGLASIVPTKLMDVYVPDNASVFPHLRLRQKGDHFELTKKLPIEGYNATTHTEQTIALDRAEFFALATSSKKHVTKDRYKIMLGGHEAEVDVFTGPLDGLILIDFEFSTQAEKDTFIPPPVCLADVTQEEFIAGGMLAGKSIADILPKLKKFGYKLL
jgi:CYTH domain-containing protein